MVLDELLRLGIVEITEQDEVKLNVEAFVPSAGADEKAFYFGQNLRDHIATAAQNLDDDNTPMLERAVSYHGLSERDVAELEALAESLGMAALKEINRRAMRMKKRNADSSEEKHRINFGVFFHRAPDRGDDDA